VNYSDISDDLFHRAVPWSSLEKASRVCREKIDIAIEQSLDVHILTSQGGERNSVSYAGVNYSTGPYLGMKFA